MTTKNKDRVSRAVEENNDKLWNLLLQYKNDPEGLTKLECIGICNFNLAEGGRSSEDIFKRAMKVCKARAEDEGMFIPRATPARGKESKGRGYVYYLTDQAKYAVDGLIVQSHVTSGTERSLRKHQKFVEEDMQSLPKPMRVLVEKLSDADKKRRQRDREQHDDHVNALEELYRAFVDEPA